MRWFIAIFALLVGCSDAPPKSVAFGGVVVGLDSVQIKFDTINFGVIGEGEIVMGRFAVRNNLSEAVVIGSVITGCGCTTAEWDKKPLKAGQESVIDFKFDSHGRQGWQFKAIDVVMTNNFMARIFFEAEIREN